VSDRHPLGFTKVNLLSVRGRRIRLHLWHGEGSEAPHDHRWSFVGIPLWGSFTETRWTITPGPDRHAVTAWPTTTPGGRSYEPRRPAAALSLDAKRVRRPLVPYRCRLGVIHAYVPRGPRLHVSLVLLAPPRRDTSTVWEVDA
jgi:hypothetical protein